MIIRVLATMTIWAWLISIFTNFGWPPRDWQDSSVAIALTMSALLLTGLAWWL